MKEEYFHHICAECEFKWFCRSFGSPESCGILRAKLFKNGKPITQDYSEEELYFYGTVAKRQL